MFWKNRIEFIDYGLKPDKYLILYYGLGTLEQPIYMYLLFFYLCYLFIVSNTFCFNFLFFVWDCLSFQHMFSFLCSCLCMRVWYTWDTQHFVILTKNSNELLKKLNVLLYPLLLCCVLCIVYLMILQCVWDHQTEGLHLLGYWSFCGLPCILYNEEHPFLLCCLSVCTGRSSGHVTHA